MHNTKYDVALTNIRRKTNDAVSKIKVLNLPFVSLVYVLSMHVLLSINLNVLGILQHHFLMKMILIK